MNDRRNAADQHGGVESTPAAPADGPELARLFQEHNASLVQLLRARLRSDQEARDVAQEAYVRLLQLDRLGTVSYLRTYLFRTALNIATDRLRNAAMRGAALRDPVFDQGVDELTPEKNLLAQEELGAVEHALADLPPQERYAFLLHRFAGLEIDEVAQRLGVTERSVRNYIVRALLRCRGALTQLRSPAARQTGGAE
jgi:RNA polymerase sigma factor (sigma-70 family)